MCNYNEPQHEISNNVVCATGKDSDQPAYMRNLIRAFASGLKGGYTVTHCWKSHVAAQMLIKEITFSL